MQDISFDTTHQNEEISLKDYLNIILRYKWLIITIFIISVSLGLFYLSKAKKIYQASSTILIENKMSNQMLFGMPNQSKSDINNNIEILKSLPVLKIAYDILKKDKNFKLLPISQYKKDFAPFYLKGNLSIENKMNTDILTVNFTSESPYEAKLSADAIAEALKKLNTDYARLEFTSVREFLASQLEEAEMRLRSSEEELRLYKIENGISILSEETKKMIEVSSDLKSVLATAETDLKVADNHLKFLINELNQQDSLLINVNAVLTTPTLNQMIQLIIQKQSQYLSFLAQPEYDESHPQLQSLKMEIENSKKKLREELRKVIKLKSSSSNPLDYRSELTLKISEAKIEKNIAEAKVRSLKKEIEKYDKKMALLPDTELQLARLERNYKIDEKTYSRLNEKYEDAKIAEKSKIGNVRIIENAIKPVSPIKPKKKMILLVSIVLGLSIGIGLGLLLNSLDSKIRTYEDIKRFVNVPVLGTIPFINIDESDVEYVDRLLKEATDEREKAKIRFLQQMIESRLITQYAPKSSTSESFRILRTNIVAKKKEDEPLSMVITSSGPKEGKSTIISNLSITMAQMNARVIIVDLDLRRPMVHTLFGYDKENGVTDILNDDKPVEDILDTYVKKTLIKNLDVITSGFIPPNPSELLSSQRMLDFMGVLNERYDYILYDAPPVIAVTDTLIIAKHTDMLLLVARVELAEKMVIKRIKEIFEHLNIDITGVIINGIRPHKYYSSYEYNYYYYYYYGTAKSKKKKASKGILRQS